MGMETRNRTAFELTVANGAPIAGEKLPMGTALPIIVGLCMLFWLAIGMGVSTLL